MVHHDNENPLDLISYLSETQDPNSWHAMYMLYRNRPEMTVREIAKHLNISIGRVYRTLREYGQEPERRMSRAEEVRSLAQAPGTNVDLIANLTGYSSRNVRRILKTQRTDGV